MAESLFPFGFMVDFVKWGFELIFKMGSKSDVCVGMFCVICIVDVVKMGTCIRWKKKRDCICKQTTIEAV